MSFEAHQRKLMKRRESPTDIRFITFSTDGRRPCLTTSEICLDLLDALVRCREDSGLLVYAWVIMPEHVHMLAQPGKSPLDRALLSIKLSVALRESNRRKRSGLLSGDSRLWLKGGGFDRNVRDDVEFRREVQYIHRNPVERGLVACPQDWQWSSVRWWMGQRKDEYPCDPPPGDAQRWSRWTGYM